MRYFVTFGVKAYYTVDVEAEDQREAERFAEHDFYGADFGEAYDIDGEIIGIEEDDTPVCDPDIWYGGATRDI
jgi:hypothetical protein